MKLLLHNQEIFNKCEIIRNTYLENESEHEKEIRLTKFLGEYANVLVEKTKTTFESNLGNEYQTIDMIAYADDYIIKLSNNIFFTLPSDHFKNSKYDENKPVYINYCQDCEEDFLDNEHQIMCDDCGLANCSYAASQD